MFFKIGVLKNFRKTFKNIFFYRTPPGSLKIWRIVYAISSQLVSTPIIQLLIKRKYTSRCNHVWNEDIYRYTTLNFQIVKQGPFIQKRPAKLFPLNFANNTLGLPLCKQNPFKIETLDHLNKNTKETSNWKRKEI